ncbi:MAG: methyltransferase domain-containing protein [Gammaproteobacteria bacterium]|nr:methyltransferase domain-containing protein [Gammaproteobacteria bacterium]
MAIFRRRELKWINCGSAQSTREQLRAWYQANPGQWLEAEERRLLSGILPTLFGYHLLQVGVCYADDCLINSKIRHQIVMDIDKPPGMDTLRQTSLQRIQYLRGAPEHLPVASDSLDVLLLSHTLEFTASPHEILREVDRTLIPEGHVVILGFNPWGWWMLWRLILRWRGKPPWCGHFIRFSRLRDWLQLLGFDIVEAHGYFYRPPFANKQLMDKLSFFEKMGSRWWTFFSGAYLIVAKKRVATLTPIRPRWRPRRSRIVTPELAGNSSASTRGGKSISEY